MPARTTALARISRGTPHTLARLARCLRAGDLVAVPTETVYGLAANAFDPAACAKIFAAKGRPTQDPLIVHLADADALPSVAEPNDAAWQLAEAFWPGPLTLVLPKKAVVPDIVTAGRPSVAVRVPAHPLFRRLLRLAGVPLAAPSANPFGYVSPTTAEHVQASLGDRIRYILDGGPAKIGLESTIVDLRDPRKPRLLRPGAITRADLEKVLGRKVAVVKKAKTRSDKTSAEKTTAESAPVIEAQLAPGMLTRHYSPHTPVELHVVLPARMARAADEAWVYFTRPAKAGKKAANIFWLDARGSLAGAARKLFGVLRQLDRRGFKKIHVELARGDGLAEAINDRLRRAATRG